LIAIDGAMDGDMPPLSFLNLIELRFLASWREHVPLPVIREGLDYAAKELGAQRLLLELDFKLYGKDLFVRYGEHLLNPARRGHLGLAGRRDRPSRCSRLRGSGRVPVVAARAGHAGQCEHSGQRRASDNGDDRRAHDRDRQPAPRWVVGR
jgi:hypothetical protein